MKWILAGVLIVLAGAFVAWQRQAVKVSYVNGLAAYTNLPGQEYILQRDCYIFKFKDHDTSWPLVGSHETVPDLPEVVSGKSVGAEFPNVRILDIARTGDHLRVASVRRDQSRSTTSITLEVLFADESRRKYPRLDAYWMLDHGPEAAGEAPRMRQDYAVSARSD